MSDEGLAEYNKLAGKIVDWSAEIDRDDKHLIAVVEKLGDIADGRHAKLRIVEIPDDVKYTIENCDGMEWVAEEHSTWH